MKNTILITGATSGFGEAIARLFADNGWNLIITGRREDRLERLKEELMQKNAEVQSLQFDVRSEAEVLKAVSEIRPDLRKSLTVLVNNAGLAVGRSPIDEGVTDDWDRMIDTNVKGLLYVTRAVVTILKENAPGQIINIASIAGKEVYGGGNVYCASKHAVDALSRSMRIDLLPHRIKVTNIAPGAAETEFSLVRFKGDQQTANQVYDGFEPLLAEDIADAVYFAATRKPHVTINDLVIMPTAQANSTTILKS